MKLVCKGLSSIYKIAIISAEIKLDSQKEGWWRLSIWAIRSLYKI